MYCTSCGAKLKEGASFCTECGAKVASKPDPFAPQSAAPTNVVTEPLPNAAQATGHAPAGPDAPSNPASESAAKKSIAVPLAIVLGVVVVILALVIAFFVLKPAASSTVGSAQQDAPANGNNLGLDVENGQGEVAKDIAIKKIDTSNYPEEVIVWLDIDMGEEHLDLKSVLEVEEEDVSGVDWDVTDFTVSLNTSGYYALSFEPQGDCSAGTRSVDVSFADQSCFDGDAEREYKTASSKPSNLKGTRWTHTRDFTFVLRDGTRDTQTIRLDDNECVLSDSSTRKYTKAEVKALGLTDAEKCIAWNEMFARLGYDFDSCIEDWFDEVGWYNDKDNYKPSLTGVADANYKLLHSKSNPYGYLFNQD